MLAGDADRERAVDILKEAFTEGRLRPEEYDERVGLAYQARTYADLDRLTQDIPRPPAPRPYVDPPSYPTHLPSHPVQRTSGYATASLVCGVIGPFTGGLSSIVAIVLGHMAKHEIRRTGQDGDGLATAGLVLGYTVVIGLVALITLIVATVAATTG